MLDVVRAIRTSDGEAKSSAFSFSPSRARVLKRSATGSILFLTLNSEAIAPRSSMSASPTLTLMELSSTAALTSCAVIASHLSRLTPRALT